MDAVPFHIGIATNDIDASMPELAAGLGVSWTSANPARRFGWHHRRRPAPSAPVVHFPGGPIHIDLMQGDPGTVWESSGPVSTLISALLDR